MPKKILEPINQAELRAAANVFSKTSSQLLSIAEQMVDAGLSTMPMAAHATLETTLAGTRTILRAATEAIDEAKQEQAKENR